MSHQHSKGLTSCQNCHQPLSEMDKYCPSCGQKNTDGHITMHDLWHELTHYFIHVDNKIFVTVRDLFIPGKLTDEFFKGHRKRYVPPITLFFVMGILSTFVVGKTIKKSPNEAKLSKGFIEEKQLYRNDLLFELDSLVKNDSTLFSEEMKTVFDTFLVKNYQKGNPSMTKSDTSEKGYMVQYYLTLDNLKAARQALVLLQGNLQLDNATSDNQLMKKRLAEYEIRYSKLKSDSSIILAKYAQLKKKSPVDAASELTTSYWGYNMGINMGKNMGAKDKKIEEITLDSLLKYPADYDPVKAKLDAKSRIIKRDSTSFEILTGKNTKIDELDIANLTINEILEKYKIEGFWTRLAIKQYLKFGKQGFSAALQVYASKSSWIAIFTMLPSAWFLLLLYRTQERLYVEHIIFLIHYTCAGFVFSALMLVNPTWGLYLTMAISFIFMLFGFKRFYKQSWGKTIAKGVIYYVFSQIISIFIAVIGIFLSVLLT
jgi:flagella basal body P-ring formation protein FlgA